MKLHPVWFALLLSATPLPAQEPGTAPAYWFENVPAGDGSIKSSLVFTTIPGVQYTVETTHNLTDWMEVASLYGIPICRANNSSTGNGAASRRG